MALNESILALLMQAAFGIFTPGAKDEYEAYAEGVVMGLKVGQVQAITAGSSGSPGIQAKGIGALQGGPVAMMPLVIINSIGVMPPPEGMPMPLQTLWYLSISMVALHVLTMLEVQLLPMDAVAVGVGTIAPGGYSIKGDTISKFIVLALLKRGLTLTPMRQDIATVIGKSTEQLMMLATTIVPIVGGAPVTPPAPAAGSRQGIIS